jgi:hypothetical protein
MPPKGAAGELEFQDGTKYGADPGTVDSSEDERSGDDIDDLLERLGDQLNLDKVSLVLSCPGCVLPAVVS